MNRHYARTKEYAIAAGSCFGQGISTRWFCHGKATKLTWILVILAAVLVVPAPALANGDLERATEAYERSHYAESVRLLHQAAEDGCLRAQEMLGLMYLYGPILYGAQVPRDIDQAVHWLRRAALAGSATAAHVLQPAMERAARADPRIAARSRSE